MSDKLPVMSAIAIKYKDAVCNSTDAERSNSIYNMILSERRRSLSEDTIKSLVHLYYNKHLILWTDFGV